MGFFLFSLSKDSLFHLHGELFWLENLPNRSTTPQNNSRPFICLIDNDIVEELPTIAHEIAFETIVQLLLVPFKLLNPLSSLNVDTLKWKLRVCLYVHVHIAIIGTCLIKQVKKIKLVSVSKYIYGPNSMRSKAVTLMKEYI